MPQSDAPQSCESSASGGSGAIRTPLLFLAVVPVFSLPFYFLNGRALLPDGRPVIPVTSLMVFVPMALALTFTFKECGFGEVRRLLARAFDMHKVKPFLWLLPAFLLLPLALYVAHLLSRMLGNNLGQPTALWADAGSTLLSFVLILIPLAIAEELGWMGYAADPLQERYGALGASALIGITWAVWHWPPWYQSYGSVGWVFWQTILDVLLRALTFWLYNNTRGSVFVAVIFHATFNVAYRIFPDQGRTYDPFAAVLVIGAATLIVISVWGPKTLANYRFSTPGHT